MLLDSVNAEPLVLHRKYRQLANTSSKLCPLGPMRSIDISSADAEKTCQTRTTRIPFWCSRKWQTAKNIDSGRANDRLQEEKSKKKHQRSVQVVNLSGPSQVDMRLSQSEGALQAWLADSEY